MLLPNDIVYSCACCKRLSADRAQVWDAALRIAHLDMTAAATFFGDANAALLHDISKRYILRDV